MIKLIASDMDGTLLNTKGELPLQFFPLLKALWAKGILFVAASGRQYHNLLLHFGHVKDKIALLCENGAMVVDCGKRLFLNCIPPDALAEPIQKIRAIPGAFPVLCGADSAYTEQDDPELYRNAKQYYERLTIVPDLLDAAQRDSILKIAVYDKQPAQNSSYPVLLPFSGPFLVSLSGEHWVDLMAPGTNKGTALRALQRAHGLTETDCMAFGDYLNDCEMMQTCYYSYAMQNAHPMLKQVSRFEAPSNDENGVVRTICERLSLEQKLP